MNFLIENNQLKQFLGYFQGRYDSEKVYLGSDIDTNEVVLAVVMSSRIKEKIYDPLAIITKVASSVDDTFSFMSTVKELNDIVTKTEQDFVKFDVGTVNADGSVSAAISYMDDDSKEQALGNIILQNTEHTFTFAILPKKNDKFEITYDDLGNICRELHEGAIQLKFATVEPGSAEEVVGVLSSFIKDYNVEIEKGENVMKRKHHTTMNVTDSVSGNNETEIKETETKETETQENTEMDNENDTEQTGKEQTQNIPAGDTANTGTAEGASPARLRRDRETVLKEKLDKAIVLLKEHGYSVELKDPIAATASRKDETVATFIAQAVLLLQAAAKKAETVVDKEAMKLEMQAAAQAAAMEAVQKSVAAAMQKI